MSIDINEIIEEAIQQERDAYASINDYTIEIGVVSADTKRKQIFNVGLTNAELMFIHENGSILKHIPARPVLEMTIQDSIKKLLPDTINRIYDGCFKHDWTKEQVKVELEKMCIRMQSMCRKLIYNKDSRLEPNSSTTINGGYRWVKLKNPDKSKYKQGKAKGKMLVKIKGKGENYPLHDTGQLARSITCRLVLVASKEN